MAYSGIIGPAEGQHIGLFFQSLAIPGIGFKLFLRLVFVLCHGSVLIILFIIIKYSYSLCGIIRGYRILLVQAECSIIKLSFPFLVISRELWDE